MRAPRALARSYSSITRIPAPSPMTKPSRPSSHGRDAFSGSSLRVDRAFIAQKPPTDVGVVAYSAPPASINSAPPYWIMRIARQTLWVAVVHAVTAAMVGPLAPVMIETCLAVLMMKELGTVHGETMPGGAEERRVG